MASLVRYDQRRGQKTEYWQWHRFKRIVARLRSHHGYNLTRLSLALGNERTWLKSALAYPYQLAPTEYEAARTLLRNETKPMMSPGKLQRRSGPQISKRENRELHRLVTLAREQGRSLKELQQGSDIIVLGRWYREQNKPMRSEMRDDLIAYLKTILPPEAFEAPPRPDKPEPVGPGMMTRVNDSADLRVVRRLLKTIKGRGVTVNDIANGVGLSAASTLSTWMHNDKGLFRSTYIKMLDFIKNNLSADLIVQAYSEAGIPIPEQLGHSNGRPAETEPAPALPEPTQVVISHNGEPTFEDVRETLLRCRSDLNRLLRPLPAKARQAMDAEVGDMIDAAILGLTSEVTPGGPLP